ncbi:class III signal peptide-containing protein [archaeon]|nr:class III signal peptide-containing protein [archaeon]
MFNKKGQGSLEYLIILAAVIAVAAVVVAFLLGWMGTPIEETSRNNQKAICSGQGIGLPIYTGRYPVNATDAANWLVVNYGGEQLPTCSVDSANLDNVKASCEIGDPDLPKIKLQVNRTSCRFISS